EAVHLRFSEEVVGQGKALYAASLAQGHEGVMAKHLASTYRPGRRSAAWRGHGLLGQGAAQKQLAPSPWNADYSLPNGMLAASDGPSFKLRCGRPRRALRPRDMGGLGGFLNGSAHLLGQPG